MMKEIYDSETEAAEAIGVTVPTIIDWVKKGRLKAERVKRAGKPALRIRHSDLVEATRGTMFDQVLEPPQLALDTPDLRKEALSLEVFWPAEQRSVPFSFELMSGFQTFHALTYTVSLPFILELMSTQDFASVEVLFGSEALVRASSASRVVILQEAIEDAIAKGYIGIGGDTDPRTKQLMEWQVEGRAKFYAAGGGVVHSKLYFLERPGLRRVLVGSANLSKRALLGRQGEILLAYDNDVWIWDNLMRKYEAALSLSAGIRLKTETKPAHLVRAEDLPAGREAKEDEEPVTIYVHEATDMPGDPEYIAVRADEIEANIGEGLRENIKALPKGEAVIHPGSLRRINYSAAPKRSEDPAKLHRLDRVNDRFVYDGQAVERPMSPEGIERDALLITQYINKFQEFGMGSDVLQRNYYALMGWLYFTPFIPALARRIHNEGGNASKELKHLAIVYGQSNCGKSALTKFVLTSMFGPPAPVDDSGFTQTDFKNRTQNVGVLPIYYQDVDGSRFSGRNRNQGEVIVKYYDQLVSMTGQYPCAIVTANADVAEFSNEVRHRAFLVHTPKGLASDDDSTRKRLDKEALPLLNRVGQDFYSEYLYRMADIVSSSEDPDEFDYLWESTRLIWELLDESLMEGEVLPSWAKAITATDFNGMAWELKHRQMASRLIPKLYTSTFPPPVGFWTDTDTDIVLGVDSVREVRRGKEIQDHWIKQESTYASGKVLYLDKREVVESIKRSDPGWSLPTPTLKRLSGWLRRKLG